MFSESSLKNDELDVNVDDAFDDELDGSELKDGLLDDEEELGSGVEDLDDELGKGMLLDDTSDLLTDKSVSSTTVDDVINSDILRDADVPKLDSLDQTLEDELS